MQIKRHAGRVAVALLATISLTNCSSSDTGELSESCVQGTVTGLSGTLEIELNEEEKVTISENGKYNFDSCPADTYRVTVFKNPVGQACVISNGHGSASDDGAQSVDIACSSAVFTTNQAAAVVIGQPDFLTADEGAGAAGMYEPLGNALVINDILYVPDMANSRVLGYLSIPTVNGAEADFVLGQADFDGTDESYEADGLAWPSGIASDGNNLIVAEYYSVRFWDGLPSTTAASSSFALGFEGAFGEDSVNYDDECGANTFYDIEGMYVSHGKMFIADSSNNRVLVWNTLPTMWSVAPDYILGQPDIDTCEWLDTSATTFDYPLGVWSDGTRLVVADGNNNRVLIWNDISGIMTQEDVVGADIVLGQDDFESSAYDLYYGDEDTETGWGTSIYFPEGVASDGQKLAVGSTWGRIYIWNTFPTANNTPADVILGDEALQELDADDNVVSVDGHDSFVEDPYGLVFYEHKLIVTDYYLNRVMIYEAQ